MDDQPSILVVDDDEGIRRTLEMILAKKNYRAWTAADGATALALARQQSFNLVLLDLRLPDIAGSDVLAQLKTLQPDLEALIITGHATLDSAIQALSAGAYHYFIKPLNVDELLVTLEKALHKQRLVIENRSLLAALQKELEERKQAETALRESEEKYRILVERANDGITIIQDGVAKYVNPRLAEFWGGTADEMVGNPLTDYVHPDETAKVVERYHQRMAGEQVPTLYETVFRRRDGSKVYAELNAGLITYQGKPADLVIIRDITERKHIAEALETERTLLRTLVDNLPDRIYVKDAASRFRLNNPAHLQALGAKSQEEVIGKTDFDFRSQERAERSLADDRQVLESGNPLINREETSVLPSGEHRWLLATKVPFRDQQGNISGLVGISRDITERKHAEEALRESEARLKEAQALGRIGNWEFDFDRQTIKWSDQTFVLYERDLAMGPPSAEEEAAYYAPEQAQKLREYARGAIEQGQAFEYDLEARLPSGRIAHFAATLRPIKDEAGRVVRLFGTVQDITARKRAEDALRESEERFRSLFENVTIGLYRTTPDGRILLANPTIVRMLGYASLEELAQRDLEVAGFEPEYPRRQFHERVEREGEVRGLESAWTRRDGTVVFVRESAKAIRDASGKILYYEGTVEDITERKQRERELLAVATVSTALRAAPTRAEMLPVILDQTQTLLNAQAAVLIARDPVSDEGVIELARGQWANANGRRIPPGQGVAARIFETGQPYVTDDLPNDPHFYSRDLIGSLRALANAPLIVQGRPVGLLSLGRVAPFTHEELDVLTAIADIAGNALYRAALHEKTEQRLRYLVALQMIDQTINASLDLRFTLNIFLDHVVAQLRVDAADILLYTPALQTLDYAAARGFRTKEIERVSLRLGEGHAGIVALERRTLNVQDLTQQDKPARPWLATGEGFISYHGVPLIAKGKMQGVLEVFHRAPFHADPEWLNFLETLASQAAIAIDNAQLFEESQRLNATLILSYDATIEGWSRALELRDQATEGHTQRVTELSEQLGRAVGLGESELVHLRRGALLHDIGKIAIPDNILSKPGALTDTEWQIMRKHPEYAYELLKPIPYLHAALDIPYCHHEKWDGTGYPRGLPGEAIPIAARIFALVDVWDALRSDRPYRAAWTDAQAREHLRAQAGKHFDPNLVEQFLKIVR